MTKKKSTAKQPSKSTAASQSPQTDEGIGNYFARFTVSQYMDDDQKREKWGLPAIKDADKLGLYIVELNVEHVGGLAGAETAFKVLYQQVVTTPRKKRKTKGTASKPQSTRKPLKIAKTYFRCEFKDHEWRELVAQDEQKSARERAIYRLWPDFPIKAQTSRSTVTIKADAALRSFNSTGEGITWAVIDSGVDAGHPHFGPDTPDHTLKASQVKGLHRCFADRYEDKDGMRVMAPPLAIPDWDADMAIEEREKLLAEHSAWALKDDFGHGTHVAGIIAGRAPEPSTFQLCVLAHAHKVDPNGNKISSGYVVANSSNTQHFPRGVAPACKLVSLRVLDEKGKGRTSQVIQALEYIREKINDNPKLMRVHGVNLSVGYEFDAEMFACGQSPLCATVDRLVQEGVVVVAAAGNTGYGAVAASVGTTQVGLSNTINDPGNAARAITVGSTHPDAPHTFGVSYFSSKGPTGDGRLKPDLVAPGERITSCAAGGKLQEAIKGSGVTDSANTAYYVDDSGTSMAAPHVAGAVAAFLSICREFIGRPDEVKRIFLESATPLGRERYFEGHGLVDLMRAIQSV